MLFILTLICKLGFFLPGNFLYEKRRNFFTALVSSDKPNDDCESDFEYMKNKKVHTSFAWKYKSLYVEL